MEEEVRLDRKVEGIVGAFGAAWAHEAGVLKYWIQRAELARLKRLRRMWSWGTGVALVLLVIGIVGHIPWLMGGAFAVLCGFVSSYTMLPSPLAVAAVWGGQVFLLKVPQTVAREILTPTALPSTSGTDTRR